MNPGGEPERDETGLPPVDIEIPDDARELDRDVQAYYREQRAARRQYRRQRVRGTLAKDGIVLPLLACCLILALITGTLLTVFTATSDQNLAGFPRSGHTTPGSTPGGAGSGPAAGGAGPKSGGAPAAGASAGGTSAGTSPAGPSSSGASSHPASSASPASSAGTAHAGVAGAPKVAPGLLPRATITVNGQTPVPVQDLSHSMLVLLPAHCNCSAAVSWLISIAAGAHARTYLVYTSSTETDVRRLYQQIPSQVRAQASLALGPQDTLRSGIPGSLPDDGLAAILVGRGGPVHYATGLRPAENPTAMIKALTH